MVTGTARGFVDAAENPTRNLVTVLRQCRAELTSGTDSLSGTETVGCLDGAIHAAEQAFSLICTAQTTDSSAAAQIAAVSAAIASVDANLLRAVSTAPQAAASRVASKVAGIRLAANKIGFGDGSMASVDSIADLLTKAAAAV